MLESIHKIQLFTTSEAQQIGATVRDLEPYWEKRHVAFPIYTLGAVGYMDGLQRDDSDSYFQQVRHFNAILHQHFHWMYARLTEKLSDFLKTPVEYTDRFALPGFHIHGFCKLFQQSFFAIHFDKNYAIMPWPNRENINFNDVLAFTVAIVLPKSGGGLNTWDLHYFEAREKGLNGSETIALSKTREKHFYPYKIGHLILQSGHLLHQVAPTPKVELDNERITIQGHGVFCEGCWQLYW